MEVKENSALPCLKKKIRISSLNTRKRKVLAQCSLNENIITAPNPMCDSVKLITTNSKETGEESKGSESLLFQNKDKSAHGSIEIEEQDKKIQQFDKLLEITSRCVDYYNKFTQQKDAQIQIVRQAFLQIHNSLNLAFNNIINQVKSKHQEIKEFLYKKQSELIKIKDQQESELNENLSNVKSVHLVNLLRDYKSGDQSINAQEELHSYANTLHRFYGAMEKVEKCNFKEGVDQTINFINNVISQEIKFILCEQIPNKTLNGSFSFNDAIGFGTNTHAAYELHIQHSIGQSLQQSFQHCMKKNKLKQNNEASTQTLHENMVGRNSILETLGRINQQQTQMKNKIDRYKDFKP